MFRSTTFFLLLVSAGSSVLSAPTIIPSGGLRHGSADSGLGSDDGGVTPKDFAVEEMFDKHSVSGKLHTSEGLTRSPGMRFDYLDPEEGDQQTPNEVTMFIRPFENWDLMGHNALDALVEEKVETANQGLRANRVIIPKIIALVEEVQKYEAARKPYQLHFEMLRENFKAAINDAPLNAQERLADEFGVTLLHKSDTPRQTHRHAANWSTTTATGGEHGVSEWIRKAGTRGAFKSGQPSQPKSRLTKSEGFPRVVGFDVPSANAGASDRRSSLGHGGQSSGRPYPNSALTESYRA